MYPLERELLIILKSFAVLIQKWRVLGEVLVKMDATRETLLIIRKSELYQGNMRLITESS